MVVSHDWLSWPCVHFCSSLGMFEAAADAAVVVVVVVVETVAVGEN